MIVSGTSIRITREYKGIVESISEVGGMIDIIYLLFSFIYGFYYQRALKANLVESIYNLKPVQSSQVKAIDTRSKDQPAVNLSHPVGDQSQREKMRQDAMKEINRKLDIVQLSKELSALRALIHLLFPSETLTLLPLFELKCIQQAGIGQSVQKSLEPTPSNKVPKGISSAEDPPLFKANSKGTFLKARSIKRIDHHEQIPPSESYPLSGLNPATDKNSDDGRPEPNSEEQNILRCLRLQIAKRIQEYLDPPVAANNALEIIV